MGVLKDFFAPSPFIQLDKHTKKVHECVKLLQPLTDALLAGDYGKIEELQNLVSKTEHEADKIKTELRDKISKMYFLSVGKLEFSKFLSYQDDIADAAEDYAVVLTLRKTKVPQELKADFQELVRQVINICEHMMDLAEKISSLAEAAFSGEEAEELIKETESIGEQEWHVDRQERKFAKHFYGMEEQLKPIDILFMEKYCKTLSRVANNAEKSAKYLRIIIRHK
ncbi:MAG: TIGR00153 family protein [Sedimentisphaerales bacterium]|nr:TIGR00153 family protein [Sedimentisphaerales bacterium]